MPTFSTTMFTGGRKSCGPNAFMSRTRLQVGAMHLLTEYIGIEQKYLSDVERGVACPSFPLMVAISDKLNISMHFLTKGISDAPQDTMIPRETVFYVPEAEGFNDRQYRTLLKIVRFMAENLKEDWAL